jgi:hypothetical protein
MLEFGIFVVEKYLIHGGLLILELFFEFGYSESIVGTGF